MAFKLLGITDSVTSCDCCGRTNLKCTIELENESGDVVFYGRDCAGAALYGRKNGKNTKIAEERARMIQLCRNALPIVLDAIAAGEDAKAAARKHDPRLSVSYGYFSDTGNKMPLRIYFNGWSVPGVEIAATDY